MQDEQPKRIRKKRPGISVAGTTYARLREAVTETSLGKFVDGIVTSALDDPTIRDRIVAKCQAENAI